jgi:hypothetical protein
MKQQEVAKFQAVIHQTMNDFMCSHPTAQQLDVFADVLGIHFLHAQRYLSGIRIKDVDKGEYPRIVGLIAAMARKELTKTAKGNDYNPSSQEFGAMISDAVYGILYSIPQDNQNPEMMKIVQIACLGFVIATICGMISDESVVPLIGEDAIDRIIAKTFNSIVDDLRSAIRSKLGEN